MGKRGRGADACGASSEGEDSHAEEEASFRQEQYMTSTCFCTMTQ